MSSITKPSGAAPRQQSLVSTFLDIRRKGMLAFFGDKFHNQGDLSQIMLGPAALRLAIHPDYVKHISIDNRANYVKGASYESVRKLLLGNGLVTSTGELWRRQRRLMSPFFTPRAIEQFGAIMVQETDVFAERWAALARAGEPIEMIHEMMIITASIILKTMFSLETAEEVEGMKNAVETLIGYVSTRNLSPIRLPMWMPTPANQRYYAARKLVNDFINGIITQRRAMPESEWPDDLLTRLMAATDEETGERMADQQILDEAITIFFAGHETTARTMTFTWYALAENPAVAARLHAEIDSVVGDRIPTIEDQKHMPYTLQVIKETLRLYPAAPVYVRESVEADTIDGHAIAAGETIMLSPYLTHRHPDFWPEPEKFDPDRWLPEREKAQHPYAYHPFAAGQRVCIGNNFSLFESHILLSILGRRFAPRMKPGHVPQFDMAGTLTVKNGVPMFIEPRTDAN